MQVILLDKIVHLGNVGDQVNVKSGFARNFLIPQGKAVMATKANIEHFETRRAELEAAAAASLVAAQARAAQVTALGSVTIASKAGDEGRLFGAITTRDVAEAVTAAGVEIAKSEVRLPNGPIRTLGDLDVRRSICNIRCYRCCRIIIKVFDKRKPDVMSGFLFFWIKKIFGLFFDNKKVRSFLTALLFLHFSVLNYKPNTANNTQIV